MLQYKNKLFWLELSHFLDRCFVSTASFFPSSETSGKALVQLWVWTTVSPKTLRILGQTVFFSWILTQKKVYLIFTVIFPLVLQLKPCTKISILNINVISTYTSPRLLLINNIPVLVTPPRARHVRLEWTL